MRVLSDMLGYSCSKCAFFPVVVFGLDMSFLGLVIHKKAGFGGFSSFLNIFKYFLGRCKCF